MLWHKISTFFFTAGIVEGLATPSLLLISASAATRLDLLLGLQGSLAATFSVS